MPYKSNAQRKLFHAKLARGEISKSTVDEFDSASKGMKLPEHVAHHMDEVGKTKKALKKRYRRSK